MILSDENTENEGYFYVDIDIYIYIYILLSLLGSFGNFSSFNGRLRPQAHAWLELSTFNTPAGQLPHKWDLVRSRNRTESGEGLKITSQRL